MTISLKIAVQFLFPIIAAALAWVASGGLQPPLSNYIGIPVALLLYFAGFFFIEKWLNRASGPGWAATIPLFMLVVPAIYHPPALALFFVLLAVYGLAMSRKHEVRKLPFWNLSPLTFFAVTIVPAIGVLYFFVFIVEGYTNPGPGNSLLAEVIFPFLSFLYAVTFIAKFGRGLTAESFEKPRNLLPLAGISFIFLSLSAINAFDQNGADGTFINLYYTYLPLGLVAFLALALVNPLRDDSRFSRRDLLTYGFLYAAIAHILFRLAFDKPVYRVFDVVAAVAVVLTGAAVARFTVILTGKNVKDADSIIPAVQAVALIVIAIVSPVESAWVSLSNTAMIILQILLLFVAGFLAVSPPIVKEKLAFAAKPLFTLPAILVLLAVIAWLGLNRNRVELTDYDHQGWQQNLETDYKNKITDEEGDILEGLMMWPPLEVTGIQTGSKNRLYQTSHVRTAKCSGGTLQSISVDYPDYSGHWLLDYTSPAATYNGRTIPAVFSAQDLMNLSEFTGSPVLTTAPGTDPLSGNYVYYKVGEDQYLSISFNSKQEVRFAALMNTNKSFGCDQVALFENFLYRGEIFQNATAVSGQPYFVGKSAIVNYSTEPEGNPAAGSLLAKGQIVSPAYKWKKGADTWYFIEKGWVKEDQLIAYKDATIEHAADKFNVDAYIYRYRAGKNKCRLSKDSYFDFDAGADADRLVKLHLNFAKDYSFTGEDKADLERENLVDSFSIDSTPFDSWIQDSDSEIATDYKENIAFFKACAETPPTSEFIVLARLQNEMQCYENCMMTAHTRGCEKQFSSYIRAEILELVSYRDSLFDRPVESPSDLSHLKLIQAAADIDPECGTKKMQTFCENRDARLPTKDEAKIILEQLRHVHRVYYLENDVVYMETDDFTFGSRNLICVKEVSE